MTINQYVDDGDIYCQQELKYDFPITGKELYDKLLNLCLEFFKEKWPDIYSARITPKPQKGTRSHHIRAQTNTDRVKNSTEIMSIDEMIHWTLGHDFYPGTTAEIVKNGKRYKLRMIIEEIGEDN